ncbi:MAG: hypothetical protein WB778_06260 [Thermoplasmata archaeon]
MVADQGKGIDLVHLTLSTGKLRIDTQLDAFDKGSQTLVTLVADGYIFCANQDAGTQVKVFNASTLEYIGSYSLDGFGTPISFAWDPLNQTAVLVMGANTVSREVAFLAADGIPTHQFSYTLLHARDILGGGAYAVSYSPATKDVYLASFSGDDIWIMSPVGSLSHVYVDGSHGFDYLIYNSNNQDIYAGGFTGNLDVLGR